METARIQRAELFVPGAQRKDCVVALTLSLRRLRRYHRTRQPSASDASGRRSPYARLHLIAYPAPVSSPSRGTRIRFALHQLLSPESLLVAYEEVARPTGLRLDTQRDASG